jgi:hypothetical protein
MKVLKRISISLIVLLIIIFLGTVFYHNGVRDQCLFCKTGISKVEQLSEDSFDLFVADHPGLLKEVEQALIVIADYEGNIATRAPPRRQSS